MSNCYLNMLPYWSITSLKSSSMCTLYSCFHLCDDRQKRSLDQMFMTRSVLVKLFECLFCLHLFFSVKSLMWCVGASDSLQLVNPSALSGSPVTFLSICSISCSTLCIILILMRRHKTKKDHM